MAVVRYRDPVTGKLVPLRVIKGDKGDQMFIRFSAYPDGTDMSEKWDAERNFMGIAFNHVAPTDKADYQWISLADISLGRYAEEGSADKYLFFVGNGTDENNRSNALTLDDDGNLNVTGDVTFGEDKFSPREAVAEQKEYIDKQIEEHTITADRVTDLTEFMEEYKNANIATGFYTGTGQHGEENPNKLTLPFAPKLMMIVPSIYTEFAIIAFRNIGEAASANKATFKCFGFPGTTSGDAEARAWSCWLLDSGKSNELLWYHNTSGLQFNDSGQTYRYIAFR